tara:strand:+ start:228 stop:437 length:210 start_codon:yes stop_codon:yes gene_type:complete
MYLGPPGGVPRPQGHTLGGNILYYTIAGRAVKLYIALLLSEHRLFYRSDPEDSRQVRCQLALETAGRFG